MTVHLSFQKYRVFWFHRSANDFQNLNLHLAGVFGRDIPLVTGKQDTLFFADVSFEKVGKLPEQWSQLNTSRLSQLLNKRAEVPVLVDELLDDRAGFLNLAHGRKYDLLFRLKVCFQITFEETDRFLSALAEPIQVGNVLFDATMDSQTDQETVVMLARKGG